ncbi:hypothetical protein BDW69DRAFT_172731 [Aspergillus filifer]
MNDWSSRLELPFITHKRCGSQTKHQAASLSDQMAPEELPSKEDVHSLSQQERIDSARGYKAALHNPRVSEEKKAKAVSMLEILDEEGARQDMYSQQEKPKSPSRVAAGLRA